MNKPSRCSVWYEPAHDWRRSGFARVIRTGRSIMAWIGPWTLQFRL